jgi:carbamoyl-phosphate synthase large subunit
VNVLLTSASRKVSLVRAFQSALARHGGGHVIAVDTNPYAPALYAADKHFLVPPSAEHNFIEQILELCMREKVGLIVPTRDEELPLFAEMRERLEGCGLRVLVPGVGTVKLCQDKLSFIDFCRSRYFATPRTYAVDEWRSARFPLFVKPRFGKSAKGARAVFSEMELSSIIDNSQDWVVQEFVQEPEYTVDVMVDFNGLVLALVPRLRQVVIGGESYVSRTASEPLLIRECARLAKELHLVGHNTIQCFWDGQQAKFVEVNPRFGGGAALGIAAGMDSPEMLLRLLDGEILPEKFAKFETDLVMMRYTDDLFLGASALLPSKPRQVPQEGPPASRGEITKLRAVLFDLDNTLYPEETFVLSGFRAVADFFAARTGVDAAELYEKMLHVLRTQGRGRVFDTVTAELGFDSKAWLRTLLFVYRSHKPMISLFPEVAAKLEAMKQKGLRLGIVTDGASTVQRKKIASLDLDRYMDVIVCTEELGAGFAKPSTVPFQVALNLLDVKPIEVAYLGDDVNKDFFGPNQLGIKTAQVGSLALLGVKRKPAPESPLFRPQVVASSLTEALRLLEVL